MGDDFTTRARPVLEAVLLPGEQLLGVAAATHSKTFGGQLYALGATDGRLLLQAVDRHIHPKGSPITLTPDAIESASLDGAGGGWWTAPDAVLDASAVTLHLRIRGGERLKLMMMSGGSGIMGALGGGHMQADGVVGIARFVSRYFPPR